MVRVRFAPSPTGFLHVGGARTALFNWLFARKNKGAFILRIEDTDEMRSTQEAVGQILKSLEWLGLDWDEGPYFQMQRLDFYKKAAEELKKTGWLYECFCSEEELETHRREALLAKRPPRYPKKCREISQKQREDFLAQGRKPVFRFKVPLEGEAGFDDMIRGQVNFAAADLEDFIVLKSGGGPTYNFACVVDDHLMEITHVIRGDDHISNTPKQLLVFKAFGWEAPRYAHLSMILGVDGARLSKRHGAISVLEFRQEGYLSKAMVNYLALLGWATETSQDLFELEELIQKFDLSRCQKSPGIFDYGKLIWMNGIYIRGFTKPELLEACRSFLPLNAYSDHELEEIVFLEQEKYKTLKDANGLLDFFFKDDFAYRWEELKALQAKSPHLKDQNSLEFLYNELTSAFTSLEDFSVEAIEKALKGLAQKLGWKNAEVFHPLRFALSGRLQGPSLFHMAVVLGREKVLARIKKIATDADFLKS